MIKKYVAAVMLSCAVVGHVVATDNSGAADKKTDSAKLSTAAAADRSTTDYFKAVIKERERLQVQDKLGDELVTALRGNDMQKVDDCLQKGARSDHRFTIGLFWHCENCRKTWTPMTYAVSARSQELVKVLIKHNTGYLGYGSGSFRDLMCKDLCKQFESAQEGIDHNSKLDGATYRQLQAQAEQTKNECVELGALLVEKHIVVLEKLSSEGLKTEMRKLLKI